MATSKQYAWYLEGNQVAIVEKDVSFDNDITSKDYGPGASRQRWESPQSSVEDGLKVKYVYSPTYRIDESEDKDTQLDTFISFDGLLKLQDAGSYDYASEKGIGEGSYVVLEKAGRFNGLHKVKEAGVGFIMVVVL